MSELKGVIEAFGAGSAWVPIVIAFGALPALYVILAIDVHKDYAELIKIQITDQEKLGTINTTILLKRIEDELYVFELDWWVIAATGVLLVAIASLGDLAPLSDQFKACARPASHDCDGIQSILRLYCVIVGLMLSFRIAWARIGAAKQLRVLYAALESKR